MQQQHHQQQQLLSRKAARIKAAKQKLLNYQQAPRCPCGGDAAVHREGKPQASDAAPGY
jgi:hypothetical protein